jgi:uncharacterized protein (DUF983 family)
MAKQLLSRCSIEHVGKQRNGRPRYWCSTHRASATGRYGARLGACEAAYLHATPRRVLELNPREYAGGVALWGAVAPVFDTTNLPKEVGIHVHARKGEENHKEIDDTYDEVVVHYQHGSNGCGKCVVTAESAVAHYISSFLNRDFKRLLCPRCGEIHLDKDFFAVKAHRRHLCHGCGHYFQDSERAVSNPIALLHGDQTSGSARQPVRPNRPRDIRQGDYPGGIQVWASNPALLWTAERPEEKGLHVHAFTEPGQFAFDETFSSVIIDGIALDELQIQYLMAQQALPYLDNKVVTLRCPHCDSVHFDQGDFAFFPHTEHTCETCQHTFDTAGRRRLVVSNPFIETRDKILAMRSPLSAPRSSS